MLYHLLYPLRDVISGFNVFRYVTTRTAFAALTALSTRNESPPPVMLPFSTPPTPLPLPLAFTSAPSAI